MINEGILFEHNGYYFTNYKNHVEKLSKKCHQQSSERVKWMVPWPLRGNIL